MIAADSKALFEEEARARQVEGGRSKGKANLPEAGQARDQAAALCGVSPRSVESASKVKARGTPALQAAVRNGEVADLPEEEQERVVAEGPKAVRTSRGAGSLARSGG